PHCGVGEMMRRNGLVSAMCSNTQVNRIQIAAISAAGPSIRTKHRMAEISSLSSWAPSTVWAQTLSGGAHWGGSLAAYRVRDDLDAAALTVAVSLIRSRSRRAHEWTAVSQRPTATPFCFKRLTRRANSEGSKYWRAAALSTKSLVYAKLRSSGSFVFNSVSLSRTCSMVA